MAALSGLSVIDPSFATLPPAEHFKNKLCELITPFFEKLKLIQEGRVLEAVSIKPSGIWQNSTYAAALKALGSTPVPLRDSTVPTDELHRRLRKTHSFYRPMGNSTFWENIPDSTCVTGIHRVILQMKEGVIPSKAFSVFQKQLSFLDCHAIFDLARYLVLLERLGEINFNSVVERWAKESPIRLGDNTCPHLSNLVVKVDVVFQSLRDHSPVLQVGQIFYLHNYPLYRFKHPHGDFTGFNLVYVGKNDLNQLLFTGLGLNPTGQTLVEVGEILRNAHNSRMIDPELLLDPDLVLQCNRSMKRFAFDIRGAKISWSIEELQQGLQGTLSDTRGVSIAEFQQLFLDALCSMQTIERNASKILSKDEFSQCNTILPKEKDFDLLDPDLDTLFVYR